VPVAVAAPAPAAPATAQRVLPSASMHEPPAEPQIAAPAQVAKVDQAESPMVTTTAAAPAPAPFTPPGASRRRRSAASSLGVIEENPEEEAAAVAQEQAEAARVGSGSKAPKPPQLLPSPSKSERQHCMHESNGGTDANHATKLLGADAIATAASGYIVREVYQEERMESKKLRGADAIAAAASAFIVRGAFHDAPPSKPSDRLFPKAEMLSAPTISERPDSPEDQQEAAEKSFERTASEFRNVRLQATHAREAAQRRKMERGDTQRRAEVLGGLDMPSVLLGFITGLGLTSENAGRNKGLDEDFHIY
jgi:hypothetical protein